MNGLRMDLPSVFHKMNIDPFYVVSLLGFLVIFCLPILLLVLDISFSITLMIWASIALLGAGGFLLYFYRDPERVPPNGDGIILSPADGKIVYIKKFSKGNVPFSVKGGNIIRLDDLAKVDSFSECDGFLIGVGMKLFDVHVNRSPISGIIRLSKRNPGKFISMTKREFEVLNESYTTIIEKNDGFQIAIIQIATFLVRGIESFSREGSAIKLGDRIGRIKIGSQVDIVIPTTNIKILINEGDRVYAAESILAEVIDANRD